MTYQFKTQEELKTYIYTGKTDAFIAKYQKIKSEEPDVINLYRDGVMDEGRCLLEWAALQAASKDIMQYLLNEGSNIDHQDGKGRTPLSSAVDRAHVSNVQFLLENGADVNLSDMHEQAPLHIAAKHPNETIIKSLLSKSADIKQVDENGATPVHIAARHDIVSLHIFVKYREKAVKKLLNVGDNDGDTPLHYAAYDETGQCAKYLLLLGADSTAQNNLEETPYAVAENWECGGKAGKAMLTPLDAFPRSYDHESYYEEILESHTELGGVAASSSDD